KPENVMIGEDGVAKVLDFGIAKRERPRVDPSASTEGGQVLTLTKQGALMGTPYYMAPEQMRGDRIDGRTDQFAWGVVAYELLSGVRPWGKDLDALQLAAAVVSQVPTPLAELAPDLPPVVCAVVARAMEKAPDARYPSMDALIRALEDDA